MLLFGLWNARQQINHELGRRKGFMNTTRESSQVAKLRKEESNHDHIVISPQSGTKEEWKRVEYVAASTRLGAELLITSYLVTHTDVQLSIHKSMYQ